jgi:uncharacterized membrane protein YkoI
MRKILLILVVLGVSNAQELTPSQVSKLKNYNHSLSGKMRYKRLLKRMAVIKKDKAYEMAEKACQSKPYSLKLSVRSNRLFYTIQPDKGSMKIDALDGQIMQKCEA